MMRESANHLSGDALNDVLIGMGSSESEAHLAECPLCRGKVENFRASLDLLNKTTLAWSEARSKAAGGIQAHPQRYRPSFASLGWAFFAVVLLLGLAVSVWRSPNVFPLHHSAKLVSPPEDSEAQIAQDNELLRAVNAAINPEVVSPFQEYDLSDRPHPRHRQRPQ